MLRCTERDKGLIVKCGLCRWLTTSQIRRMYFADSTLNAVQKRLRQLADEGYLRTHRENIVSEMLHAPGPRGRAVVEGKGIGWSASDIPRQIAHLVGINDIRLAVEMSSVPVAYFFAHWQFASMGWRQPVIPDAVFAVRASHRRSFAVEFDRATEGVAVLVAKLRAYEAGLPDFPFEAILIVTEGDGRTDSLGREVRKHSLRLPVLVGSLADLQAQSIDDCSFLELGRVSRKLLDAPGTSGGA
jgi:hypothetical protein